MRSTLGKLYSGWGCPGFKSVHLQEDINSIYGDWKISRLATMSDEICQLKANFKPGAHSKFFTSVGLKKPTQLILGKWTRNIKGS